MGDSIFGSRFWLPDLVVRSSSFFVFLSFLATGRAEWVLGCGFCFLCVQEEAQFTRLHEKNFKDGGNSNCILFLLLYPGLTVSLHHYVLRFGVGAFLSDFTKANNNQQQPTTSNHNQTNQPNQTGLCLNSSSGCTFLKQIQRTNDSVIWEQSGEVTKTAMQQEKQAGY